MSVPCYEYIQLEMQLGDLETLNALGSVGWHIVTWVVEDIIALPTPIPAKGALGLWEWNGQE